MKQSQILAGLFTIVLILILKKYFLSNNGRNPGIITEIIDGDTIIFQPSGDKKASLRIRLFGIDCPEYQQKGGNLAYNYLIISALGKQAELEEIDIDKYKRIVGKVFINGYDLSDKLLKNGLAWIYARNSKGQISLDSRQEVAKAKRLGIWGLYGNIENPQDFRSDKRKKGGFLLEEADFSARIVKAYAPELYVIERNSDKNQFIFQLAGVQCEKKSPVVIEKSWKEFSKLELEGTSASFHINAKHSTNGDLKGTAQIIKRNEPNNNQQLTEVLVKKGICAFNIKDLNMLNKKHEEYKKFEEEAKERKTGIWNGQYSKERNEF